jgi:membrane fusion protein (multidrug efflux system)
MRRALPILAVLVLLLIGAFALRHFRSGGDDAATQAGGGAGGGPPGGMQVAVEAVTLQPEPLQGGIRTVGTLRADESVVVRPEVAGRIVKIHFAEGERVKAGVPLFSLDASVWRADLNEAQANLIKARRADTRADELSTRQLIAKSDVDTVKAELGVSQARVASAQAQLAKATIVAPFEGVLGLREVSEGEFVNPGQALVGLVKLDPIEVDFSLPESELSRVAPGQTLRIEVDAYPGRDFVGTVSAIDPNIDIASRSAKLRAGIANPENLLRPGLFARITLDQGDGTRQALMLPEQALLQQGDTRFVYRVVDGKAARTEVKTGLRVPGKIEIVSGLSAGDQVITAGQSKPMMFDGAAVMVAGAPAAAATPGATTAAANTAPAASEDADAGAGDDAAQGG